MTREPVPVTPWLASAALMAACSGRQPDARAPSSIMAAFVAHPPSAATVAEAIPTGVAAPDGGLYFVSSPAGIDAIDTTTGTTLWSTGDATIPVLALPDIVLAIRGADPIDAAWTGPGTLVAIDRAAPHIARSSSRFDLPLARHRLLDVRIADGALVAGWHARGEPGALTAAPSPIAGGLRVDLATGAATVLEHGVPDAVRAAVAGQSLWSPAGRGTPVWYADGGWSAVVLAPADRGRAPTLYHWAANGQLTTARLVEPADIDRASVDSVDAHRLYLRRCDRGDPVRCELRVLDAATGQPLAVIADPAARLEPPYAYMAPVLVATQSLAAPGQRVLVAFDVDAGHERWRRPMAPRAAPVRRP